MVNVICDLLYLAVDLLNMDINLSHIAADTLHPVVDLLNMVVDAYHPIMDHMRGLQTLCSCHPSLLFSQPVQSSQPILDVGPPDHLLQILL